MRSSSLLSRSSLFGSLAWGLVCLPALAVRAQTVNQTFTYSGTTPATGNLQFFVVPAGVTSLFVRLWGAGGGSSTGFGDGGGGAFVSGNLNVLPGSTLTLLVGGGGAGGINGGVLGGFGGGGTGTGGGGGRSALLLGTTELVDAGGGGGGNNGGGAGGVLMGKSNGETRDGRGGTQFAGGAGGAAGGSNGSPFQGGNGVSNEGGGGGGYFGGGSGGISGGGFDGAGGGGSSLIANLTGLVGEDGSGRNPGGTSDPFYIAGVGVGTPGSTPASINNGGNGEIVISYIMPVPEPGSVALLVGMGVTGAGFLMRRRKKLRKVA